MTSHDEESVLERWMDLFALFKELYREWIAKLPLLSGCDPKFMDQIASRLHEVSVRPGGVVAEQWAKVDKIYMVHEGTLEGLHVSDGVKEQIQLKARDLIGEAAVVCEIPHMFAVSAHRKCTMFWIDIHSFKDIKEVYFKDKKIILEKLKEWAHQGKFYHWSKKVEANIESELHNMEILRNSHVQHAIICGVPDYFTALEEKGEDFKVKDPDGQSPLHIAISRGASVEVIASLLQSKNAVNWRDNFGVTPLMEAIKRGERAIFDLLIKEGARLHCDDVGSFLCKTTSDGDLSRLNVALACPDVDRNAKSYSGRTALHVAARKGETSLVRALLKGKRPADVHLKDRWGFTAVNEAKYYQHDDVVHLLESYCDV